MTIVVKIGGTALEDAATLRKCAKAVAELAQDGHRVAVVHGGGSALTRTLQNVGASLGVAIMGSILSSSYQAELAPHLAGLPARLQTAADSSVAVAAAAAAHLPAPLAAALLRAAQEAYVHGMADVLHVTVGMLIAGAVLMAAFLPSRPRAAEPRPAEPIPAAGIAS